MGDPDVWPALLDMNRDDCKRILRRLELEAYSNLVSVLRAQGNLTAHKRRLLKSVAQALSISEERHKAECRRAVNSEKLATIAMHMGGANTGTEWAIEGRRLVPLLPRLVPQTAFTAIADKVANMAVTEGAKLPLPVPAVKKRLPSPPIDETLLEPNIPEASKTLIVSSVSSPPGGSCPSPVSGIPTQTLQHQPQPVHSATTPLSQCNSPALPSPQQSTSLKVPVQGIIQSHQYPLSVSPVQVTMSAFTQVQSHQAQTSAKVTKHEETPSDERVSRKRPRSSSLDVSLDSPQGQTPIMPPPAKKEALSPLSPQASSTHLTQLSPIMSPQSHSQLVQQQTLQAAAAAAAAVNTSTAFVQASVQSAPQVSAQSQLQALPQQLSNIPSTTQTAISSASGTRTVTIPTQGTVKLCLGASAPSSGTAISSGTHKVIIVSSTAPSIMQRSLSVPVVKTLTTSAPSLPSPSTLIQSQPSVCSGSGNSSRSANPDLMASTSSISAPGGLSTTIVSAANVQSSNSTVPSKGTNKVIAQTPSKPRPRANSIVIPVTPNPTNVLGSMSAAGMQLKTALQASKQGVLKTGDSTGLKILPLSNVPSNAKILPKPAGPGPIYVVSSTSVATQNVSVVTRSVPSGARVMTFTSSSVPRVAVSTSQGGTILSMSPKPVQTLQLAPGNPCGPTSGSASPKPNVIVVQKGATPFGRGTTLSHASKDVVAKVLLGGKGLSPLSQPHVQAPTLVQTSTGPTLTQPAHVQLVQSQPPPPLQSPGQAQTLQNTIGVPSVTSAPRMVTIQKLPSTLVSGSTGTSNVIVFDLSQEQFHNSAVLNEIFSTSSFLGSNNAQSSNNETARASRNVPTTSCSINSSTECNETNVTSIDVSSEARTESSPSETSNTCSDIFSTALSNANLTLNDFLEDSSLDEIPPASSDVMRLGLTSAENNSNSSHSNISINPVSWVCNENSQNSLGSPDSSQV